ncbi:MAG: FecR domain-containing protein [Bdellovibrio sp.]|nr:FecR domain-containing protein [Bdellovibrio sp.]
MRLFLILIAVGILSGIYFLTQSKKDPENEVAQKQDLSADVAVLSAKNNEVQYKRNNSFEWPDAIIGLALSNYDSLRTGKDSSALVTFDDSSKLNMAEDTLVVILDRKRRERGAPDQILSLPNGQIHVESRGDERSIYFEVRTPAGWVRPKHGGGGLSKVKIRGQKQLLVVTLLSGTAEVATKGKTTEMNSGETKTFIAPKEVKFEEELPMGEMQEENPPISAMKVKPEFVLESPSGEELSTVDNRLLFKGYMRGDIKVFLNGKKIIATGDGSFRFYYDLEVGKNILGLQIESGNNLEHRMLKVWRKQ